LRRGGAGRTPLPRPPRTPPPSDHLHPWTPPLPYPSPPVFHRWRPVKWGCCVPILQTKQQRPSEPSDSPKVTPRVSTSPAWCQGSGCRSLPFPIPRRECTGSHRTLLQSRDTSQDLRAPAPRTHTCVTCRGRTQQRPDRHTDTHAQAHRHPVGSLGCCDLQTHRPGALQTLPWGRRSQCLSSGGA
jgi:hypothetical protein